MFSLKSTKLANQKSFDRQKPRLCLPFQLFLVSYSQSTTCVPMCWSAPVCSLFHRPCWVKANINTHELFWETDKIDRRTDKQAGMVRGGGHSVFMSHFLWNVSPSFSLIFTCKGLKFPEMLPQCRAALKFPDAKMNPVVQQAERDESLNLKLIRFDQYSPSQFKAFEKKWEAFLPLRG